MLVLVIVNGVSIGVDVQHNHDAYTGPLAVLEAFLFVAFSAETLLKLFAFGPSLFLKDSWNTYDTFVVI